MGNPGSSSGASLNTSTDDALAKWDLLGPLMSREMSDVFPNEDISCPDLFKLGDKHILLCISHIRGARYYVGHFANHQFHPEAHHRMTGPAAPALRLRPCSMGKGGESCGLGCLGVRRR